jgi:hypothetical protein
MIELKINFTQIRNRVEAAAALQEAGKDDAAKAVIRKLAADILDRVKDDATQQTT